MANYSKAYVFFLILYVVIHSSRVFTRDLPRHQLDFPRDLGQSFDYQDYKQSSFGRRSALVQPFGHRDVVQSFGRTNSGQSSSHLALNKSPFNFDQNAYQPSMTTQDDYTSFSHMLTQYKGGEYVGMLANRDGDLEVMGDDEIDEMDCDEEDQNDKGDREDEKDKGNKGDASRSSSPSPPSSLSPRNPPPSPNGGDAPPSETPPSSNPPSPPSDSTPSGAPPRDGGDAPLPSDGDDATSSSPSSPLGDTPPQPDGRDALSPPDGGNEENGGDILPSPVGGGDEQNGGDNWNGGNVFPSPDSGGDEWNFGDGGFGGTGGSDYGGEMENEE